MNKIECKYKFQDKEKFNGKPYCTLFNELCENVPFVCDTNCQVYEDYKQLQHWKHQAELGSETCDRQDKEIQELKKENDSLKNKFNINEQDCWDTAFLKSDLAKAEDKIEKIKKIAETNHGTILEFYEANKAILQIINQEE